MGEYFCCRNEKKGKDRIITMIRNILGLMKSNKLILKAKRKGFFRFIPDKKFYELEYLLHCGSKLDWNNPDTISAKLNWIKLYDRKPIYHQMVDKYKVRTYIKKRIGSDILIPLYGVWNSFAEIDFDALPQKFVLKCTHDSGSVQVINKEHYDKESLKKYFNERLKIDYFHYSGREWPYKGVRGKLIAEKFLENNSGAELQCNKFYCFNGEPRFVSAEKGINELQTLKFGFYDFDFNPTPFYRDDHPGLGDDAEKPKNMEKMIEYARILSKGTAFLRVDLYEVNNHVYFSELTFTPAAGFVSFKPEEWNKTMGDWIDISGIKNNTRGRHLCN